MRSVGSVGDIVLEASTRRDFIAELGSQPGGDRIRDCIQCGTCSGSCPVSYFMDNPPRKLLAMIRAGMRDEVLGSQSLWCCTSCYACTIRCPAQIGITDIMYALKRLAMAEGKTSAAAKATALATCFGRVVDRRGRNFEPELLVRYWLRTSPLSLVRKGPLGLRLLTRGRLPLRGERIRAVAQLRTIVAKATEIGGP